MQRQATVFLLGIALAAGTACEKKEEPRTEVKSTVKSTSADGAKTTTTTEATQIGSTLAGTTETKSDTAQGKSKVVRETVIGTVTAYKPNSEIVILTGNDKKHRFALDKKNTRAEVASGVTVGTKVQLTEENDAEGNKMIRVVVEPNR